MCSSDLLPVATGDHDGAPAAVLGYPETLYPEYRKKIRATYVPPPPCKEACGQAGNFVRRREN